MQTPVIFEQDQAQRISPTPSMMTTLGLAEGEVLEHLERYGSAWLRDLTRELEWSSWRWARSSDKVWSEVCGKTPKSFWSRR